MKPDPPDQSGRPARPLARIYTDGYGYGYFKYPDNGRITDFEILVGWIPARPTKYKYKLIIITTQYPSSHTRPLIPVHSFSTLSSLLSFFFLTLSPQSQLTTQKLTSASPSLSPSFTLRLYFNLISNPFRHHGSLQVK